MGRTGRETWKFGGGGSPPPQQGLNYAPNGLADQRNDKEERHDLQGEYGCVGHGYLSISGRVGGFFAVGAAGGL
jgi:hypothetical protein